MSVTEEEAGPPGASASATAATSEGHARQALELVHHHPGRLRVRTDALRAPDKREEHGANGHTDLAARVRDGMEALPGITRITHNARTGSLLVEYEPGLVEPDAIVSRIAEVGGLVSPLDVRAETQLKGTTPAEILVETTRELNAVVFELTGWKADLRSIVPAGIAALGAYSFIVKKDDRLPRWDNLLYWSYNIFTQLHQREIRRYESIPHGQNVGESKKKDER